MAEPMIELKKIVKKYEDVIAVNGIDLIVNQGELVTLLGASGCGKTTTLKCITGQLPVDQGQIFIKGKDISNLPTYQRNLGMVFQNFALFPHLSLFDNVAFPLLVRKMPLPERKAAVMEALKMVKLENYTAHYPRQLSGGQQQRVSLARALVYQPEVILFDEPLSNLDAKLREEMRFEIKELQKRLGLTAIYVTHDQDEALALSDKVAIMNLGTIEQYGTPEEIYQQPRTKFVANFIGLSNFLKGKITAVKGAGFVEFKHQDLTLRLECRITDQLAANIVGAQAEVLIRPNHIKISPCNQNIEPNEAIGKIIKRTYLGDKIDYRILLLDSVEIRVQTEAEFAVGERVVLSFREDQCKLIDV